MRYEAANGTPETGQGIFVVEDEGIIAHDLAATLRKGGYEVAGIASSGEEALLKLSAIHPQLIIMDIRLGGTIDGIELAEKVQAEFDVPVVYLSAHSDPATLNRAKLTGPFAYLSKPVAQKSLFTSIEIALFKHHAESELRRQRAWLQTILDSMADGVIVTDQSGAIEYMNQPAERLTGWRAADAQRKTVDTVLPLINLGLESPASDLIPAAIASRMPCRLPSGLHAATHDGASFAIDGEIEPSGEDEDSAGAVITFRDATERLKRESVLRHEQKMLAVARLAGGVAHDFNNLLTVIIGFTDMALNDLTPGSERARLLQEVRKASQTAAAVTQKLLSFSNKRDSDPQIVNWNSLIREHEVLCRHLLGPGITWSAILAPDLGDVQADPATLVEILLNLVTNARDAMADGGHLTLQTANIDLENQTNGVPATNRYVSLTIEDTGSGMDAETADRLFEPFFTTKFPARGTGLGLAIVDGLIRELGGSIDVDSEPALGSTFTVYVPRVGAASSWPVPAGYTPVREAGQKQVLIVEDDPAIRRILMSHLEAEGFSLLDAACGSDALKIVRALPRPLDLLLTDVLMPNMTGPELARQLIASNPALKVIFISGLFGSLLEDGAFSPHVACYLQKPFSRDELLKQVHKILSEPGALAYSA